ncbi:MAG TPA: TetR family transcriptional regulator [Bryobacteraceae bacterium]|jgi:AcrR family transcriptional regulator|nr:TetR family transcriptional regulator [Bryobacteraceae bacterium]
MPEQPPPSPRSRPKGEKRERTRARLLEAARALIREKGHEHTTLEDIAERAGMTTGAIYGNFKNRDDLFIALGQTYWTPIKPRVKRGASFSDVMRAMADATIAAIPDRAAAAVGRLAGLAYTLTHEDMRARVASVTAESYANGEEWLREVVTKEELPMPAGQLVRVLHALTEGLVFQRLLTPELVPDRVIRAAFLALAMKRH